MSAMKYQIKVLNTPTISIDNREAKVGDWFDDKSTIVWSKDNQAMRVVSEDNKVYTLSGKLYKESNSKTFADFILYTKPLAARGVNDDSLIAKLQERFDNDFVMLDKIIIDFSDIDLPENTFFRFYLTENVDAKSNYLEIKPIDGIITISWPSLLFMKELDGDTINMVVILYIGSRKIGIVNESLEISILPLAID